MLRVDTALYGGAMLVDRLLALVLLPLLTRAIGAADYGAWTQTLVSSSLLLPLVLFAFPTTIVRSFAAAARAGERLPNFRRLGAIALALLCIVSAGAWLARVPVARWIWGDESRVLLVPALLGVLAGDAAVEFANAWLRAAGRIGWIAAGLLLRSVLRYAVVWVLVVPGRLPLAAWLPAYALAQAVLGMGLLALAAWLLRRQARSAPLADAAQVPEPLGSMLRFSAPLVALALFGALNASLDRFLLVRGLGLETVAVYAAAMSLCAVPGTLHAVLGFTLFPALARAWHEGRRGEARRLTRRALSVFAAAAVPLAAAIAAAGPWLLPWLTTAGYRPAWPVFVGQSLAVVSFGLYQILLYPLLLDGRSGRVLRMAMVSAAANAALNLALIPLLGMSGAALAIALCNTAMLAWALPQARAALARTERR
ncbi:MAG TPA: lipopolysaccharide biosynthesis protein [Rubrivivax sp.]|nr:lipopolysaccharide biosynthesis protein [Rubrivivax sp.]